MEGKCFHGVSIKGIAAAVPNQYVSTDDYRKHYDEKEIERFIEATGIRGRYLATPKQTAADLCFVAADMLMHEKQIDSDIDALIFATQTPDYKYPSTAFILQKRLKIKKDCLVFDVNLGCSSFVTCVYMISGMIESGMINRAMLLIGDAMQQHPVTEDHSSTMMFGDAGTAVLIEKDETEIINGMVRSDGEGYKALIAPYPGARYPVMYNGVVCNSQIEIMDGSEVFLFAIKQVPKLFGEFYSFFNVDNTNFDYCILHQANKMITDKITKKLKMPKEMIPISIEKYGNTNGASVPLTICSHFGNENAPRKIKFITSGFGIGLSLGVVSFDIDTENIFPVICTDQYFKDGFSI